MSFFGKSGLRRIFLFVSIFTVIYLTAFCSKDELLSDSSLTADELYLVKAYVSVTEARILHTRDPILADSLFARLDSTIDSSRISNTIETLNAEPERWITIFSEIEKMLQESTHRGELEETR